jgi:hypothetical protein
MQIDYSSHREFSNAYYFFPSEKETIAFALKDYNKKLELKLKRLENSPKNEGQVTFTEKIREIKREIKNNLDIINNLI